MHRIRVLALAAVLLLTLSGMGAFPAPAPARGQTEPPLASLLGQMPAVALGGGSMVAYSDLALAAGAAGIAPPGPGTDVAEAVAYGQAVGRALTYSRGAQLASPDWREVFGFGLSEVDQILEYVAPPDGVTLFRGRFDADAVQAAWREAGYVASADGAFLTAGDDFALDLSSARARLTLAATNYAAILPDGTLAFAPSAALITATVRAAAGDGQSLVDGLDVPALLAVTPDNLAGGIIAGGGSLASVADPALLLTPTAGVDDLATAIAGQQASAAAMPRLSLVLLGVTLAGAGGATAASPVAATPVSGEAMAVAVVVTASPADAVTAAGVITDRLDLTNAGSNWREFFTAADVSPVPGEPAVLVQLTLAPDTAPYVLVSLFSTRSLTFLAWAE